MKFSWKIFVYTYIVMVVSFGIGGFLIIQSAFDNNLESRKEGMISSNQYLSQTYLAMCDIDTRLGTDTAFNFKQSVRKADETSKVTIGYLDDITSYQDDVIKNSLTEGKRLVRLIEKDEIPYLQVVSALDTGETIITYVENLENVNDIFKNRNETYQQFQGILLVVAEVSGIILLIISLRLTGPLIRLSQTADEIGNGNFGKRVGVKSGLLGQSEEIQSLTENFNRMAGYVENYVYELKEENRRREEFIGNFTHELKTPLTSIIGYADLLRSYEMDSEKRRQFADFIYREGSRMEALALHLLDLIVLQKNEFELKSVDARRFFFEVRETLPFLMEKYHAKLHVECDDCEIRIEPDLLKTFIYNLVDNGCKAVAGNSELGKDADIWIQGRLTEHGYLVSIRDNGMGIPKDEIRKITEAFYMVDKSRARTMGGAGLGLALCKEIARIHGSHLDIESEVGKGTEMTVLLAVSGEVTEHE